MDILYLLIPLSLVLVFLIAIFFWWSLRSNQYDDLEGPGYRILMDDDSTDSDAVPGEKQSARRDVANVVNSGTKLKDI